MYPVRLRITYNYLILQIAEDVYCYKASGVQVTTHWELPIVIQWPCKVRFNFKTQSGSISFGIVFVAAPDQNSNIHPNDIKIESVEDMAVVHSTQKPGKA